MHVTQELCREAEFFHERIFGQPIPDEIRARYVRANGMLLKDTEAVRQVRINLILERSMDVEAIEFALRRRAPQNLLTKKLLILCYLAESRSDYYTRFVNEQEKSYRAYLELSVSTLRSLYKLLKGRWLIWRYDVF